MLGIRIPVCVCFVLLSVGAQSQDVVTGVSFDAHFFAGGRDGRYGVIVLTGSNGGKADAAAQRIAEMGYDVLSLAYFDRSGSPLVQQTLELVPLEYFQAPKQWLMDRENTRDDGVIVYGLSKGAELALVLASHDEDYKAVVALAPSHVVWQGNPMNFADIMSSPSSWSLNGKGLPFVPYVSNEEKERLRYTNRHAASLTNETSVRDAAIPVENIDAPVLLLSGRLDTTWPAVEMGDAVCATINSRSQRGSCQHVIYDDGDHLLSNHEDASFTEVYRFLRRLHAE